MTLCKRQHDRIQARLAQIARGAVGYFQRTPLAREEELRPGSLRFRRILSDSRNPKPRISKKPDNVAWWMNKAIDYAEAASKAIAANDMESAAYLYGEAIAAFNYPFFEVGLRSLYGARSGGKTKSTANRDRELAVQYRLALASRPADLPRLTKKEFARDLDLEIDTALKAIKRGEELIDKEEEIGS